MKATASIATGFIPFFHVANHVANYSNAVNLFSNIFIPGYDAVFPEETIKQLNRLDGEILRDSFIISNNTHRRTLVFFPKELVPGSPSDIQEVRCNLGNLVIVGDLIRHYERVRVSSNGTPSPTPVPSSGPVSTITASTIPSAGKSFSVTLPGDLALAANVVAEANNPIQAGVPTWDSTTGQLTVQLVAPQGIPAGVYVFDVVDANGNVLIKFSVKVQ
jgi:hypothetical protein